MVSKKQEWLKVVALILSLSMGYGCSHVTSTRFEKGDFVSRTLEKKGDVQSIQCAIEKTPGESIGVSLVERELLADEYLNKYQKIEFESGYRKSSGDVLSNLLFYPYSVVLSFGLFLFVFPPSTILDCHEKGVWRIHCESYTNRSVVDGYLLEKSHEDNVYLDRIVRGGKINVILNEVLKSKVEVNKDGVAKIDFASDFDLLKNLSIYESLPLGEDVRLTFQHDSPKAGSCSLTITVPRATLDNAVAVVKALPADLAFEVRFLEENPLFPNEALDAGEKSNLKVKVTNSDKGTAFGVNLIVASDVLHIQFPKEIAVGDIPSGESREVAVPVVASLDLASGKIPFEIHLSESRGYDSKKQKVIVAAEGLERPAFVIADVRADDGTTGLARGNGNGIPENGETVELTAIVRNEGPGSGLGVKLMAEGLAPEIVWEKNVDDLGKIPAGGTVKAKVAFTIPRNFSGGSIAPALKVTDLRSVGGSEKTIALQVQTNSPSLQYAYRILSQGRETGRLVNGEDYVLELSVRNDGKLPARKVAMAVAPGADISVDRSRNELGEVAGGGTTSPTLLPFTVPRSYAKDAVPFAIKLSQSEFPGTEGSIRVPVSVRRPTLAYETRLVSRSGGNILERGEVVVLEVEVVNSGDLAAEAVSVSVESTNDYLKIAETSRTIGRVLPDGGRSEAVKFTLTSIPRIAVGSSDVKLKVTQRDFPSLDARYALDVREVATGVVDLTGDQKMPLVGARVASATAPKIELFSPADREVVEEDKVQLAFDVSDAKKVEQLKVSVNGVSVSLPQTDQSSSASARKSVPMRGLAVPLIEGENRISIYADNPDGGVTRKEIVVTRKAELNVDVPPKTTMRNPKAVAVVIGNRTYNDPGFTRVDYATRDAEVVKAYLENVLGYSPSQIIYRENAGMQEFRRWFGDESGVSSLSSMLTPGESDLFIYYSGHGAPDTNSKSAYFVPVDAFSDSIRTGGYSVDNFYKNIAKLPAKSITVVLDSCFSGAVQVAASGTQGNLIKKASPGLIVVKTPSASLRNGFVLSSAKDDQISSWYPEKQHGLFTYYFLKGLGGAADKNKNGELTNAELSDFLESNVPKMAQKLYQREQVPTSIGKADGVIVKY